MSLLGQLTAFFIIRSSISKNAHAAMNDELVNGEQVLDRLIEQNSHKLTLGVDLLASDPGFRSALKADHKGEVDLMLERSSRRIGATASILLNQDERIVAHSGAASISLAKALQPLLQVAKRFGSANSVVVADSVPYLVAVSAMQGMEADAYVAMLSPVGLQTAREMARLTPLQATILVKGAGSAVSDSTLPASTASTLAQAAAEMRSDDGAVHVGGTELSMRRIAISRGAGPQVYVVLSKALSEAIEPYRMLQLTLLLLTGANIIIIIVGSLVVASRITRPLQQLSVMAQRLGNGDYDGRVTVDADGEIGELAQAFTKMRENLSTREREIQKLAFCDAVTNLPNRLSFTQLVETEIEASNRSGQPFSVLLMDLDRFKHVNDVLGHAFGDLLLQGVAKRVTQQFSLGEAAARLGGDEFALLLPNVGADKALVFARKILHSFEKPLEIDGHSIDVGAGIGVASYPEHGNGAHNLLSHAELALYAAKQSGNEAVVYLESMNTAAKESLSLLGDLRRAIDERQFLLYVQPQLSFKTGKLIGVEALVRWKHPVQGMIFPDRFIPFAEKTGFIRALTMWVFDQAAQLWCDLDRAGHACTISINISARDLLDPDLPLKFSDVLERYGAPASGFCLEITESTIMEDPQKAQQTLETLHGLGVELSIDDFGTGYSSLAYLKSLAVDELKIDKSFVMNMEKDPGDGKIVKSTIDLGHNMGLRVVAEGVESVEAWAMLAQMGCDHGQGYFMSRPIPSADLLGWLAKWKAPEVAASAQT
jgi:diguanylate cyclase (GGDEF)-like protein